jgi:hypothetical protein
MEIGKGKMALLKENKKAGHKFVLTKKDIAWLLCVVWPKSFGSINTNQTATCERGWNPLNRACLDDYEMQNAGERLEGRGDWAYRKVLATFSQLACLRRDLHPINARSFHKTERGGCCFLGDSTKKKRNCNSKTCQWESPSRWSLFLC